MCNIIVKEQAGGEIKLLSTYPKGMKDIGIFI
jgi:hypothetical protein